MKWEGAILTQSLYDAEARNTRFIPVVFSFPDTDYIPIILKGQTYYGVSTETGYEALYRHLTDQPEITKPKLGRIKSMPVKKPRTDFFTMDLSSLRRTYLNRVLGECQSLYLSGIDRKAVGYEDEACLSLESVYTALLTRSMEKERFLSPDRDLEEGNLSALKLLDKYDRLVLLGDPGSGKSTFVNFVAICLSGENLNQTGANLERLTRPLPDDEGKDREERQPWRHGPLLPVRIVLRDFAARGLPERGQDTTAEDLWRFIESELSKGMVGEFSSYLRQELMDQGGIILLDGLDEVPEADMRREQIKSAVEDFAQTFDRCRILVTSRTYVYQKQNWRLSGFKEAELAPFSAGQIRRFVDQWYRHLALVRSQDLNDAQGRAELLKRAIFNSSRLFELARRPLLLTLMASLHAWRGGSLPEKREELYADAVDLLLYWWERPKSVKDDAGRSIVLQPSLVEWLKADRDKMRSLLNKLAYQVHRSQPELVGTADIPGDELVKGLMDLTTDPDVKPRRLVEYLSHRASLIVPRGDKVYTFPHRTFQEYLAACYVTDEDYPYHVAELVREDPNRWREVVLLAGAKAGRGTAASMWMLVDALCYLEPGDTEAIEGDVWGAHLAGLALVETTDLSRVHPRDRAKLDRIKRWLIHIIGGDTLPPGERALAGRTLAHLGDPRLEVMTVNSMEFCFVPSGPFWMGEDKSFRLNEDLEYDYWMARYPVTNAQYGEFVRSGGYTEARYWSEAIKEGYWKDGKCKDYSGDFREEPKDYGTPFTLSNHPVVGVSWYEVCAFIEWLKEKWHKEGVLPQEWSVVLPSEAEWEKASRGGVEIPEQIVTVTAEETGGISGAAFKGNPVPKREYPWGGDEGENLANSYETGINSTSAVGCFPAGASPYGCEEMAGNVWEWCKDRYERGSNRVIRGGSWLSHARVCRSAYRGRWEPDARDGLVGFRVLLLRS